MQFLMSEAKRLNKDQSKLLEEATSVKASKDINGDFGFSVLYRNALIVKGDC